MSTAITGNCIAVVDKNAVVCVSRITVIVVRTSEAH